MALFQSLLIASSVAADELKPNVIIIFTDDQGYNDLGCFGSKTIKTPHIDRMAKEGKKLTNYMVPSSVCSPSRAALQTGCYPKRVGMHRHVLFPQSTTGLNPEEYTLGDMFRGNGYATATIGKWHLGHHPETLPRQNGYDYYFGIPYSNDMNHPDNKNKPKLKSDESWKNMKTSVKLWNTPLIENEKIIELPVNQRTITRRYTDKAIEFLKENKQKACFVYLAHSMPHIPLYVPEDAYDADPKNAYKCVIEHIDAEVGRLMDYVRSEQLERETIVIFTSDNGPWLSFGSHGGSALPLRAGKGTTFEGGQRVPCVVWAPGKIEEDSQYDDLVSSMDLMPTLAAMARSEIKSEKKIDGIDVSKVLFNGGESPRNEFVYYSARGNLEGIRRGAWKLLIKGAKGKRVSSLFNLEKDLSEKNNLIQAHPELVSQLSKRMLELDAEIEANKRPVWKK
jgi:arylsulfatase A-like enzyme